MDNTYSVQIPRQVAFIIDRLQSHGYEAYAVGGCVRDMILGREPNDWDITTSAKPEEVKAIFKRTVDTGIQHGTVTVLEDSIGFEVTTYRIDGEYEDGRHPKEVQFTKNLVEDLKRRDFTINAMAYSPQTGIVDVFQGQEDLKAGIVRCVGRAQDRFTEDALRIMRAVRFAAQLGFEIEEKTLEAVKELAPTLKRISAERIQVELSKLLVSPHPEMFRVLYETGITAVILPEFDEAFDCDQTNKYHCYTVGEHTLRVMEYTPAELTMRLTGILHDLGKPAAKTIDNQGNPHFKGHEEIGAKMASKILKRLKYDNHTLDRVCRLVRHHDYRMEATEHAVRHALNKVGEDLFMDLMMIEEADAAGKRPELFEEAKAHQNDLRAVFQDILKKQQCVSLKTLAVSGKDLIADGRKPGKELGVILNTLLEHVLDVPEDNEKEILLKLSREM